MVEPTDLTVWRVRELEIELAHTNTGLDEVKERLLALERDMAAHYDHRIRHEIQFGEIRATLSKIARRLEISNE